MHDKDASHPPRRERFGLDDLVIVPLAAVALVAVTLLRWAWNLLVHILDYLFPIFLQIARFVLFTFRILGDGLAALLRFVIKFLPLPPGQRQVWRDAVARSWSWLRRKLSYKAFEAWVHHLFEDGMAWVFRVCRKLSPTGALLVILLSLVWMPVSFLAATAVHTWLIAEATSLPSWMQIFHVVATVLAKSKLLMLPVYPASWPQAKQHPIIQFLTRALRWVIALRPIRKFFARYRELDRAGDQAANSFAMATGLEGGWYRFRERTRGTGEHVRNCLRPIGRWLRRIPIVAPILRTYDSHYDRTGEGPSPRLSQRVKDFFRRWEIKFKPAYYEAKEAERARQRATTGP